MNAAHPTAAQPCKDQVKGQITNTSRNTLVDPYPGPGDLPLGRQPERQHRLLVILGMPVHPAAHPPLIILVGHSYGGAVITAAGTDDRVAGLVYISALGPDETETSQSEQEKFPQTPVFGQIEVADGRIWMLPSGAPCFCGDLPEEEQKIVWATAYPPSVELFARNAPGVAWRTKPSWYIVANHDQAVHPDLERAAAKRMGATTYDIDSSHVPMLSQPGFVLDVIRAAAAGV